MIEWQDKVDRSTLRCVASERPINPGEEMVSVLRLVDDRFQRLDYHAEAWNDELAASAVSWWRYRRPDNKAGDDDQPKLLGVAALRAMFDDLRKRQDRPSQCFAYLLALLLTRRRKLHFIGIENNDDGDSDLIVEDKKAAAVYRLRDPQMNADEQTRVESDLDRIFTGG